MRWAPGPRGSFHNPGPPSTLDPMPGGALASCRRGTARRETTPPRTGEPTARSGMSHRSEKRGYSQPEDGPLFVERNLAFVVP